MTYVRLFSCERAGTVPYQVHALNTLVFECPYPLPIFHSFQGNTEFLEKLTARGNAALLGAGSSPGELKDFNLQMEAFAVRGGAVYTAASRTESERHNLRLVCLTRKYCGLLFYALVYLGLQKIGGAVQR